MHLKILKKVMNFLMITDSVMMKIIKSILADVDLQAAADI